MVLGSLWGSLGVSGTLEEPLGVSGSLRDSLKEPLGVSWSLWESLTVLGSFCDTPRGAQGLFDIDLRGWTLTLP